MGDSQIILSLGYRYLLSPRRAPDWGDRRESQQRNRVVVGGNPVLALDPAAVTTMDHHLLSVRPKDNAYCCHQCSTRARSIPWPAQIDVT
jgi:hypothetical protein